MPEKVTIALVGIGGYGNTYVTALLDAQNQDHFRLVGVVDPAPHLCRRLAELEARRVPVYPSMDRLYTEQRPELVIISTPLQFHAAHSTLALRSGSHVLCEKPLCVTPQQAQQMKAARDAAGNVVSIGYQWSFSDAIQNAKQDILAGRFGRAKRLRALVLWPRDEAYYGRNRWAGAKTDAAGNLVLDSPVNNACAHYLHNLLYLTGSAIDRSALPATLTAELYRAHPIQNYDTAALRGVTAEGVEIVFVVSHATRGRRGPVFSCEFEHGTIEFADHGSGGNVTARFSDGTTRNYGSPNDGRDRKIWLTVQAMRGNGSTPCGIEAAEPHTLCTWAAQQSTPQIAAFDPSLLHVEGPTGSTKTWVEGLDAILERGYEEGKLPSELGATWARPARAIAVG